MHIIKEEDISFTAVGIEGLSVTAVSDDECDSGNDDRPTLSAAVVAAHARNALRAPSLQTLLDDIPVSTALSHSSSSAGDSDGKSKYMISRILFFYVYHTEQAFVVILLCLNHVLIPNLNRGSFFLFILY